MPQDPQQHILRQRSAAGIWNPVMAAVGTIAIILLVLAVRHVHLYPDALIYFPAYLIFIYLFFYSWLRVARQPDRRDGRILVAAGISLSILRYPLLFTPLMPYLDILTVSSFYALARSQTLLLQESRGVRRFINGIFLTSLVCYMLMVGDYWLSLAIGPQPYLLTRIELETKVGPVWLLASLISLIAILLYLHIRAIRETDDIAIRLRLSSLILTWCFFLVFFVLDEGVHFGWFEPRRHVSDLFLLLPSAFIQLGLAMPNRMERFFYGLDFLDRRTSRELTLFVLTQIARNSTGSALTELALAAAERLGLGREERRQIYLACEFLDVHCNWAATANPGGGRWEELKVSSQTERRRLATEQQLVFKAWRLKRAVEQGAPGPAPAAQLVAAARDYLLGLSLAGYERELAAAVREAAAGMAQADERASCVDAEADITGARLEKALPGFGRGVKRRVSQYTRSRRE